MMRGELEVVGSEVEIMGIGLLVPGEVKTLDEREMNQFRAIHGYPIGQANFPISVRFTMVVEE